MLSIGRIGAGDGYRYLTEQVASQDAPRHGENLAGYYEAEGMPPGRWMGAGAPELGVSGVVGEEEMGRLFGRCEHPTANNIDPATGNEVPRPLGRRMAVYRSVAERIEDRLAGLRAEQRAEAEAAVTAEEVNRGTSQAVTGFDLTFSAPKSVSVAWGLGDERVRDELRSAHEAAWRHAVGHLETEVASTRLGQAGVAQVATRGLTGAAFEHWYSRAGDPQLHTHVAVSAMVQTEDGRWRRLDSRATYRAAAAVGERYTGRLLAEVEERLGWGWDHRSTSRGVAVPELAGMDAGLVTAFSTRSSQVDANLAGMVSDYRAARGNEPSRAELAQMAQQAVLEGRPLPSQKSWNVQQERWRTQVAARAGIDPDQVAGWVAEQLGSGVASPRPSGPSPSIAAVEIDAGTLARWMAERDPRAPGRLGVAARAIAELEDRGSTWSAHDIDRMAARKLREQGWRVDEESIAVVRQTMTGQADLVRLTPEASPGPEGLLAQIPTESTATGTESTATGRNAIERNVFARVGEDRWTSQRILDGEARLHELATAAPVRRGGAGRTREVLERTEARMSGLDEQRSRLLAEAVAARAEEARLRALAAETAEARPAYRQAVASAQLEETTAARVADIDRRLASAGGRRQRRQAERDREALSAQRAELVASCPGCTDPEAMRARRAHEVLRRAERVDRQAANDATAQAETLAGRGLRAERRAIQAGAELATLATELDGLRATVEAPLAARVGNALSADQRAAVARLADPDRRLDALIGPAGAGKTTTLAALADVARDQGRSVMGLAPTAAAAAVLGEDLGVPTDTLDKALDNWRKGRGRPGPGTVVIIDEASMASTPKLVEAIDTTIASGGVVRLAGDPRQLAAVGAGGGLGIVASAAGAPRLSTLHRFNQPWEGPATLRLRERDPDVLATYEAQGRVSGGGRHAMMGETFESWRSAGGDAVMIAGDNDTVAALSAMARADRVATGQVETEGVTLANGSTAGVGDVIATRRNARTIPVGDRPEAGGYVRNRDRWIVTGRGEDGSLDVEHQRTGGGAHLPAGYVASEVELGYALTAYGAQGMTVDEAHVLVAANDAASLVYVGMTRGRDANYAHVVTENFDEEPGHLQTEYGGPLDALARALANEDPATATDSAQSEAARESDPAVLVARYQTVVDEDRRARMARASETAGSELLSGDDAWQVLEAAAALERSGGDPARIVAELGPDTTVSETTQAMVAAEPWARTEHGQTPAVAGLVPAVSEHADPTVALWTAATGDRLLALRARAAEDLATGQPPAWTAALGERPHDPEQAREWADSAAQVSLYRDAAGVTGHELLGPAQPGRSPLSPARRIASDAASAARHLGTGEHPGDPALGTQRAVQPATPEISPQVDPRGPSVGL